MGQREEEQDRGSVLDHVSSCNCLANVEHQVAVGDVASLGLAGGARRVDERCEVVTGCSGRSLLDDAVVDVGTGRLQLVQATAIDDERGLDVLQLRADLVEALLELGVLEHDRDGIGIACNPFDLVGGTRFVDRDDDAAGGPDGEVEVGPFDPSV